MTDSIIYPHIVVIGSIPDRGSCFYTFENMTIDQAHAAFEDEMLQGESEDQKEEIFACYGSLAWIDRTICSASPMLVFE